MYLSSHKVYINKLSRMTDLHNRTSFCMQVLAEQNIIRFRTSTHNISTKKVILKFIKNKMQSAAARIIDEHQFYRCKILH